MNMIKLKLTTVTEFQTHCPKVQLVSFQALQNRIIIIKKKILGSLVITVMRLGGFGWPGEGGRG
jgi:hypothetical protein